ncbi:MAG: YggT family protein [Candidatus Tectimicrobiota bacterium]
MFVLGNFLQAVALVLNWVLWAYMWIVIGAVIVSWVSADPYNPIVRFLYQATEPVFYQVRRYLPVGAGGSISRPSSSCSLSILSNPSWFAASSTSQSASAREDFA